MILQHMNSLSSFRIIFASLNQIIHLNNAVCAISFGSCFLDAYIYFILVKGRILLKINIMSVSEILILFLLTAKSDCETCLSLFRVAISLKIYIHVFLTFEAGGGTHFPDAEKDLGCGFESPPGPCSWQVLELRGRGEGLCAPFHHIRHTWGNSLASINCNKWCNHSASCELKQTMYLFIIAVIYHPSRSPRA